MASLSKTFEFADLLKKIRNPVFAHDFERIVGTFNNKLKNKF